ncbi:hypothetical protein BCR34DRAFT_555698 [Clohesyomyces aquaticus]|uniref:Uncharacterized protein n=1 Tax=Clohesyomyces aquaticus TaxID=1231657 RepID=A0A1Y2A439_9PLEO|nr:hypothetical protein BCR34DRAFT_555698 [Clohesyomyces aquaticus]
MFGFGGSIRRDDVGLRKLQLEFEFMTEVMPRCTCVTKRDLDKLVSKVNASLRSRIGISRE